MTEANPNNRLETFCDGVFAIALTLLIVDVKIPPTADIRNTGDFWRALGHVAPSIYAFVLSFGIILITWVNHHHAMKLVNKSSPPFIYANGFLLLTVAFVPFPTSLLGEYLFTGHAGPAVVLYSAVLAFQAVGWNLISQAALRPGRLLTKNERSTAEFRKMVKFSYSAFALYTACAIAAFWIPLAMTVLIGLLWIFWLIFGIRIKEE
jgi:uncharacterized membrane protein